MVKNTQKPSYFVKKSHFLGKNAIICAVFLFILCLTGCAKTAGESIAYTAHQQLNAIEQSIKPECMTASTTEQIKALHSTITSQLSNCELAQSKLKSDITKWQVISGALFGLLLLLLYIKILRK